jgi:hypothetical protein
MTWDLHLAATLQQAKRLDGIWNCLERFAAAKMSGGLQKSPPRASDLVWSAAGATVSLLALGVMAAAVKSWPVVGQWHQQVCVRVLHVCLGLQCYHMESLQPLSLAVLITKAIWM